MVQVKISTPPPPPLHLLKVWQQPSKIIVNQLWLPGVDLSPRLFSFSPMNSILMTKIYFIKYKCNIVRINKPKVDQSICVYSLHYSILVKYILLISRGIDSLHLSILFKSRYSICESIIFHANHAQMQ